MRALIPSFVIALSLSATAHAQDSSPASKPTPSSKPTTAAAAPEAKLDELSDGVYAVIETTRGRMVASLAYDKVPNTVGNFIGLAEGSLEFTDPKTGDKAKRPFYDGLNFHRVIKDFMIQGGCPLGTGQSGPGYKFAEEFHPDLKHSGPGILSMAKTREPSTTGSQFFITLAATSWLDNKHSVFGHLVQGQDVLAAIGASDAKKAAPGVAPGSPAEPVVMTSVRILRVGDAAKAWSAGAMLTKKVPEPSTPVDSARVPSKEAESQANLFAQFVMISYRGAPNASPVNPYDKAGAKVVADKIVALARAEGADFGALVKGFSDIKDQGQSYRLPRDRMPKEFGPIFKLGVGQVSDAIDAPQGWMVFYRSPTIFARHILISWKGSKLQKPLTRSKEEAQALALKILGELEGGAAWADVVKQSDDVSTPDGNLGEFAADRMVKAFADAAFALAIGGRSELVESGFGYHIIERLEPSEPKPVAPPVQPKPAAPSVSARHILISWKGTPLPGVTRSKEEARALVDGLLKGLTDGTVSWKDALAKGDQKAPGGDLGSFTRDRMVKPFADTAFDLEVGARSAVVETRFGFHIIERTK